MDISTVNKLSLISFLILLSAWAFVAFQIINIQEERSIKNEDYHLRSYNIANELRQSSDDLTRMARTYVSTGDTVYEQRYFEILDIRNGKSPRPKKYPSTYWYTSLEHSFLHEQGDTIPLQTLMLEMGFTQNEFSLLRKAQNRSDELVRLEMQAFAAMKGLFDDGSGNFSVRGEPDSDFASGLLFSQEYEVEKIRIMKPIQEFLESVELRMSSEASALHNKQTQYLWYGTILVIISALLALTLARYLRVRVVFPIFSLEKDAQAIADGNYQTRCKVSVDNEIGLLSQSLNVMADAIELHVDELEQLATTDGLIGISNRRSFLKSLEFEMKRSYRYGSPLSVLMMDVDNFKSFNDSYGHQIGDEVLKLICRASQKVLRDNDLIGRLGGEEFAIFFPATNLDSAMIVAERIRIAVENSSFLHASEKLHVTISIGITQLIKDDLVDNFLNRADMAMYHSKNNGRNQTSFL